MAGRITDRATGPVARGDWRRRRRARLQVETNASTFKGLRPVVLLLLPTYAVITVFAYYPVIRTAIMSLYDIAFLGRRQMFVGTQNYQEIFTVAENLTVVLRTVVVSALIIVGVMAAAVFTAALLQVRIRGTRVYRLLLIWPIALSTAITGLIFLAVFNPTFGVVNQILSPVGIAPNWLQNPLLAQLVVVGALIWTRFGYNLVFYTAAYQNLPRDLMDAALVDGASAWQRFRHVTFPLLTPISLFLLVTNTAFAFFDSFALIHVMTGGGPLGSTTVLMYDIYENAFEFRRSGFAAAQVMLLFLAVAGLMLWQFRATRRRVHYG